MKRLEAYFTGTVQGVGFRYTAQQVAAGYDVMGSVRNIVDGRVELMLEGEQEEIEAYLKELEATHLHDRIKEREFKWMEPKRDLKGFRILR